MPSTYDRYIKILLEAAKDLKLPHCYNGDCFQKIELKFGPNRYYLYRTYFPFNDRASTVIAGHKKNMNALLHHHGVPVPESTTLSYIDYCHKNYDLSHLPYPIVAKPTHDTARGQHVVCNIQNKEELEKYLAYAFSAHHPFITFERFIQNLNEYRVFVFYGKVIGVIKRKAPCVIGDGIHSIAELITIKNKKHQQDRANLSIGNVVIDQEHEIRLKELGFTLDSIPKANEPIQLCYRVNAGLGGTMIGIDHHICPKNAALFRDAAKVLNLNLVGFDVICADINLPISETEGYILEANSAPDFTLHEKPFFGKPQPVVKIILKRFIRMHPFYYLKHRITLALPPIMFNIRLWSILGGIVGFRYLLH